VGGQVEAVALGGAALEALSRASFDMAFLDLRLGTESGLDLIPRLLAESPSLAIIVITAYATFETAVEAIRRGAKDYVPKPFTPAQIRQVVDVNREVVVGQTQLGSSDRSH
jgi:two-component system, NtrC family, response regulator AlgB